MVAYGRQRTCLLPVAILAVVLLMSTRSVAATAEKRIVDLRLWGVYATFDARRSTHSSSHGSVQALNDEYGVPIKGIRSKTSPNSRRRLRR